jgi:hypothetical protein
MPKTKKELNDTETVDIADKFVERLEDFLESAGDSIDLDRLSQDVNGWTAVSQSKRTSIYFDIIITETERTFVVRSLTIESTAGLPGKILRFIGEISDRYHLGIRNEAMEIPDRIKDFLQRNIGCVPGADGCLIRPPH